jgi:hypothetical protein
VGQDWSGVGGLRWNFIWRRRLFVWEETLVEEIVGVLREVNLTALEDRWCWIHDTNGEFSVKFTYAHVFNLMIERGSFSQAQASAFKAVWKCPAPSKVQLFG